MGEQHTSRIERILHRIEERLEEWRKQDRTYKAQAAAQREKLWAEAAEREKLLAEAVSDEEAGGELPVEEAGREQRVVFVVHSEAAGEVLEGFAGERVRLLRVVPAHGDHSEEAGVKGSWLVFG